MGLRGPVAVLRRTWVRLAFGGAVIVALFVIVTSLYDAEGQVNQIGGTSSSPGMVVAISPVAVQPGTGTATVRVAIQHAEAAYVDDGGRLGQPTRLTVITDAGVVEERYPAGTVPGSLEVAAGLDGDLALYPFDDHTGQIVVVADAYETTSDGAIRSVSSIPVGLVSGGGVSGWRTTLTAPTTAQDEPVSMLLFERAFSTRAFAVLILGLSVMLAVLSLFVGLLVRLRRRVIEATMLSWFAALLFALPALRNFMPGSPPIGVALDVYVFLWVMVCAVLGVALAVLAWIDRDRDRPTA